MERIDMRFVSPLARFALTGPPIRPVKNTETKQEEQTINHINIHSTHPTGVPKMKEYAEKYFPNTELSFNRL